MLLLLAKEETRFGILPAVPRHRVKQQKSLALLRKEARLMRTHNIYWNGNIIINHCLIRYLLSSPAKSLVDSRRAQKVLKISTPRLKISTEPQDHGTRMQHFCTGNQDL